MLKKCELKDVPTLFELMSHPDVFPFVRYKANTLDECYFATKEMIELESERDLISRTILNESEEAIGTINLYDLYENSGFLNTWIGQPYFGNGYSKVSKELFFEELFLTTRIEVVYLKIRKTNIRSLKSTIKLPYAQLGNTTHAEVYEYINEAAEIFDLFVVEKVAYLHSKALTEEHCVVG